MKLFQLDIFRVQSRKSVIFSSMNKKYIIIQIISMKKFHFFNKDKEIH